MRSILKPIAPPPVEPHALQRTFPWQDLLVLAPACAAPRVEV